MIDWDRVEELRDEVGAEDFDEIALLFLQEVDEVSARLASAPEPATLQADLHFLKGSALNLGFARLARLCAEGERLAAEGAAVALAPLLTCYAGSRRQFLARTGLSPLGSEHGTGVAAGL